MLAAAAEPAINEDPPEEDPRAGSSVTGMSGLSDLMLAEPNAKAGDTAVGGQPPPIREAKFASAEAAQNLAQSAANLRQTQRPGAMSQQSRRLAILIIALLAFGVAIAGIGLVMLGGSENTSNNTPGHDRSTQDRPDADPTLDPAGPPAKPGVSEPGASRNHEADFSTPLARRLGRGEAG